MAVLGAGGPGSPPAGMGCLGAWDDESAAADVEGGLPKAISAKEPCFFISAGGSTDALGCEVCEGPKRSPESDWDPVGGPCGGGIGGRLLAASTNSLRDFGAGRLGWGTLIKSGRQRCRKPVKPLMKAFRVNSVSFFSVGLALADGCSTFSALASLASCSVKLCEVCSLT